MHGITGNICNGSDACRTQLRSYILSKSHSLTSQIYDAAIIFLSARKQNDKQNEPDCSNVQALLQPVQ